VSQQVESDLRLPVGDCLCSLSAFRIVTPIETGIAWPTTLGQLS